MRRQCSNFRRRHTREKKPALYSELPLGERTPRETYVLSLPERRTSHTLAHLMGLRRALPSFPLPFTARSTRRTQVGRTWNPAVSSPHLGLLDR